MAPVKKVLSLDEKYEIIKVLDKEKLSVRKLAERFNIGKTQAGEMAKNKELIRDLWHSGINVQRKKSFIRPGGSDVDQMCLDWYKDAKCQNLPINGPILMAKAREIAEKIGYTGFMGTHGWLEKWRKRHNIHFKRTAKEPGDKRPSPVTGQEQTDDGYHPIESLTINQMPDDTEKLIAEMEKRPALYESTEKYDKGYKRSLWKEVCLAVVPDWKTLSPSERKVHADDLYKKWCNLRTCFRRELDIRRQIKDGRLDKKKERREFLHFEKLHFLLPSCAIDMCLRPTDETDYTDGFAVNSEDDSDPLYTPESPNEEKASRTLVETATMDKGEPGEGDRDLLYTPEAPTEEKASPISLESCVAAVDKGDPDEDMNFAMSIVPSLRQLTADEKLDAKIKILTIFRDIRQSRVHN